MKGLINTTDRVKAVLLSSVLSYAGLQIRSVFSFLKCVFLYQIQFDHLLESSHRDDSNKWSNIGFGQEIIYCIALNIGGAKSWRKVESFKMAGS